MKTARHFDTCAPALLSCGALVIAAGLMVRAWLQWQSESRIWQQNQASFGQPGDGNFRQPAYDYFLFFSQGWAEEQAAWQILEDTGTEIAASLSEQSAVHLRHAYELYRQALLRRPLCVYCQHSLARLSALFALMSQSREQIANNPSALVREDLNAQDFSSPLIAQGGPRPQEGRRQAGEGRGEGVELGPLPLSSSLSHEGREEKWTVLQPNTNFHVVSILRERVLPDQETASAALAQFRRSLALAPTRADLWEESGLFLLDFWPALNEGERSFVLAALQQVLTLDSRRTENVLAAAFAVDPDLPAVVSGTDPRRGFAVARLYQEYEDTERAQRQAQTVADRLREQLNAKGEDLLLLGEVELFLDNQDAARDAYVRGFAHTQDQALRKEFCWRLADWHLRHKDYVTAAEYYRRYMTWAPDHPRAVLQLGISVLRGGNQEEGLRWLERAAGMRPGDAGWQQTLARQFEQAGRYDRANAIYRRLLVGQSQPQPGLLRSLARNYKHLGLQQQALATYRRLLTVDAGNAEAQAFVRLAEGPTQD